MNDNKKFGEKPQIEYYKSAGVDMVRIPYNITEVSPGIYTWRELSVKYINFNYGGLVSSLIGLEYSPAEMTAVVNNYLLDSEDEETKVEFQKMQECRKNAKAIAHWIIDEYK